jgi:hypothetical protein
VVKGFITMQFTTLVLVAAGMAMLSGCAPAVSIHPLYTAQELAANLPVEGNWVEESGEVWRVTKADDGYDVTVLHAGESPSAEAYNVHFFALNGLNYADATSKSDPGLGVSGHVLVKISLQGDRMQVALLDDAWVKKMVQAGLAPKYETSESNGQVILTASTSELQEFLLLHAGDPGAWEDDDGVLQRMH